MSAVVNTVVIDIVTPHKMKILFLALLTFAAMC